MKEKQGRKEGREQEHGEQAVRPFLRSCNAACEEERSTELRRTLTTLPWEEEGRLQTRGYCTPLPSPLCSAGCRALQSPPPPHSAQA